MLSLPLFCGVHGGPRGRRISLSGSKYHNINWRTAL